MAAAAGHPRADGPDRDRKSAGDLLVGELAPGEQQHHVPLVRVELGQCRGHLVVEPVVGEFGARRRGLRLDPGDRLE
jgi:hypothetical protein